MPTASTCRFARSILPIPLRSSCLVTAAPSLTDLLRAAHSGDTSAAEAAGRVVYAELHQLAAGYLGRERPDHTLQPTALVNEAWLRLVGQHGNWNSRSHFFGVAAQMMRRILVDHARRQHADRRDRDRNVPLDSVVDSSPDFASAQAAQDVLDVHEALDTLLRMNARQAQIVELKFFVGLSIEEIAETLDISPATVNRDWNVARQWLRLQLSRP
jgi:RNA polymerase sigma-70 factor, ECF subfamily